MGVWKWGQISGLVKKEMEKESNGEMGREGGGWRPREGDRSFPHTFDSKKAAIS
jgi:hypothetical protein